MKEGKIIQYDVPEAILSSPGNSFVRNFVGEISSLDIAVGPEYSLKSVLSRMLGQGIKNIPVIDKDERLIREISLRNIEGVSEL